MRGRSLLRRAMTPALVAFLLLPAAVPAGGQERDQSASELPDDEEGEASDVLQEPVFPPTAEALTVRKRALDSFKVKAPAGEAGRRPPNVVLMVADDLGYGDTGVYGSTAIPTPHIDALAAEGARFTDAYVTAAICSPSRASLLTGAYQQRFGFEFNMGDADDVETYSRGLDPAAVTLADVLKQAGYATGAFGKWHLGSSEQMQPLARGFDTFYGFLGAQHIMFPARKQQPMSKSILRDGTPIREPEYLTDAIARETVAFITAHRETPFFAYVPFNAVHKPIQASQEYLDRFPEVQDEDRRTYYAMTSALDDAVGAIVAALEKHGLAGKTLVIFLNDNGGALNVQVQSNAPLRMGKVFLFEGGVRVPMIVKWPGQVKPGTVFDGMTSALDIFPTVCAAAGITLPPAVAMDGVDLLPFLRGQREGEPHQALFWRSGTSAAVRQGDWKLIRSGASVWLFDLARDIGEKNNLAASQPERVRALEESLQRWQNQMKEPAWPTLRRKHEIRIDGLVYEINL